MGDAYPELIERKDFILSVAAREEDRFSATLRQGLSLLEQEIEGSHGSLPGDVAFKLLDIVSKGRVREFLARRNTERGVTILLTTHDLADVERLCSRVVVIDSGRLICDGSVEDVKARYGGRRTLVVDLDREHPPLPVTDAEVVAVDGVRQRIAFVRGATTPARLLEEVSAAATVVDMAVEEPDIEDVVRRIYAESGPA